MDTDPELHRLEIIQALKIDIRTDHRILIFVLLFSLIKPRCATRNPILATLDILGIRNVISLV